MFLCTAEYETSPIFHLRSSIPTPSLRLDTTLSPLCAQGMMKACALMDYDGLYAVVEGADTEGQDMAEAADTANTKL